MSLAGCLATIGMFGRTTTTTTRTTTNVIIVVIVIVVFAASRNTHQCNRKNAVVRRHGHKLDTPFVETLTNCLCRCLWWIGISQHGTKSLEMETRTNTTITKAINYNYYNYYDRRQMEDPVLGRPKRTQCKNYGTHAILGHQCSGGRLR